MQLRLEKSQSGLFRVTSEGDDVFRVHVVGKTRAEAMRRAGEMLDDAERLREGRDFMAEKAADLAVDVDRLRAESERLRRALSLYSCEDGCNDCPEHERDRVGCGWTARAALAELKGESDA